MTQSNWIFYRLLDLLSTVILIAGAMNVEHYPVIGGTLIFVGVACSSFVTVMLYPLTEKS